MSILLRHGVIAILNAELVTSLATCERRIGYREGAGSRMNACAMSWFGPDDDGTRRLGWKERRRMRNAVEDASKVGSMYQAM